MGAKRYRKFDGYLLMMVDRGRTALKTKRPHEAAGVDWLAYAIGTIGLGLDTQTNIARAAQVLGVGENTIYTWLEKGLVGANAKTSHVLRLSELSGVSMDWLARRPSPFPDSAFPKRPAEGNGARRVKSRTGVHGRANN